MSGRQQAAVLCVPRQANAVAWTSKLDVDTVAYAVPCGAARSPLFSHHSDYHLSQQLARRAETVPVVR